MVQKIRNNQEIKQKNISNKIELKEELKEFKIEKFKKFKNIKFEDLGKINIFFGNNNCGKSTILEALFLANCGYNVQNGITVLTNKRTENPLTYYDYGDRILGLFNENDNIPYKFNVELKFGNKQPDKIDYKFFPSQELSLLDPRNMGDGYIENYNHSDEYIELDNGVNLSKIPKVYLGNIEVNINGKKEKNELEFPNSKLSLKNPLKVAAFHDILAHRKTKNDLQIYSQLKRYGIIKEFISEMKNTFPIINDIDYIPYPNGSGGSVYIQTIDGKNLPLHSFGDGMRKWYYLLGRMIVNHNAIHCIEEVDSTLHVEAQKEFSKNLVKYAEKYGNQLFITTHSIEFADEFLEALYNDEDGIISLQNKENDPIRFFTLKASEDGKVDVYKLTGKEAYERRLNYGLELR